MSATDAVQAALDEAGIVWHESENTRWSHSRHTTWGTGREWCRLDEDEDGLATLVVTSIDAERAVLATLGRGECRAEHAEDDTTGLDRYICDECGTVWWMCDTPVCHCPRCGRRVVGE